MRRLLEFRLSHSLVIPHWIVLLSKNVIFEYFNEEASTKKNKMGTGQESLLERLTKTVNLKVNPVKYFRRHGLKPQSDKSTKKKSQRNDNFERTPLYLNIAGYISYLFLNCVGIIRGKFPYLLHIPNFFFQKKKKKNMVLNTL